MADYGVTGQGNSLRDALLAYQQGAVFPPQLGAPAQPDAPVPIPPSRPPMPVNLPPGGVNMPMTFPAAQAMAQQYATAPGTGPLPALNYGALLQYAR